MFLLLSLATEGEEKQPPGNIDVVLPSPSLPCIFLFHKVHRVHLRIRQPHRITRPLHICLKFGNVIIVVGPVSMESSLGWESSVHLGSRYLESVLETRYKPRCKFQQKLFGKCLLFILAVQSSTQPSLVIFAVAWHRSQYATKPLARPKLMDWSQFCVVYLSHSNATNPRRVRKLLFICTELRSFL